MNRTYSQKKETIERAWYLVDATGIPVGRLAAQVAQVLRGKHKPTFTYNQDCGDFVVVINADKVVLSGTKAKELIYWHSQWPGGLKSISRGQLKEEKPERLVEKVITGMTPKNKLGDQINSKLKVYAGSEHPHAAQNPQPLKITKD